MPGSSEKENQCAAGIDIVHRSNWLVVSVVDGLIMVAIPDVDYAGIDVPCGWPQDYVPFVQQ